MKRVIKVARIGNSKGIRLKKELLEKYGIEDSLILEEAADYIVLKPVKRDKLTWEETYQQMAAADEDWADWDGIGEEGWPRRSVPSCAERSPKCMGTGEAFQISGSC